jgi:endonuclease IV
MIMVYRELNKVIPTIYVVVSNIAQTLKKIISSLGSVHAVLDLAKAFSRISLKLDSQGQFSFTQEERQ